MRKKRIDSYIQAIQAGMFKFPFSALLCSGPKNKKLRVDRGLLFNFLFFFLLQGTFIYKVRNNEAPRKVQPAYHIFSHATLARAF